MSYIFNSCFIKPFIKKFQTALYFKCKIYVSHLYMTECGKYLCYKLNYKPHF